MLARALGASSDDQIKLAAAIELIYASLALHEGVEEFKDRPGASSSAGNADSILLGDLLYTAAFKIIVDIENLHVMQILADTTNTIAEGEVLYRLACLESEVSENRYIEIVRMRTAKLFEAAARCSGILAGVSADIEACLSAYGMHLGTAYSILMEAVAFTDPYAQAESCCDYKISLPAIYARRYGSDNERRRILKALEGNPPYSDDVRLAIKTSGAAEASADFAVQELALARSMADVLEKSEFKTLLKECAFLPRINCDRKEIDSWTSSKKSALLR